jgi:hypothetical protein
MNGLPIILQLLLLLLSGLPPLTEEDDQAQANHLYTRHGRCKKLILGAKLCTS